MDGRGPPGAAHERRELAPLTPPSPKAGEEEGPHTPVVGSGGGRGSRCPRCGHPCRDAHDLSKHLRRKRPCQPPPEFPESTGRCPHCKAAVVKTRGREVRFGGVGWAEALVAHCIRSCPGPPDGASDESASGSGGAGGSGASREPSREERVRASTAKLGDALDAAEKAVEASGAEVPEDLAAAIRELRAAFGALRADLD